MSDEKLAIGFTIDLFGMSDEKLAIGFTIDLFGMSDEKFGMSDEKFKMDSFELDILDGRSTSSSSLDLRILRENFPSTIKSNFFNSSATPCDDNPTTDSLKRDELVPRDDEPVPKDDEPVPKDDEPVPKDDKPVPRDDEPVPRDEEPVPRDEEPVPRDNELIPYAPSSGRLRFLLLFLKSVMPSI